MPAVKVNASGSRNDLASAKAIPRAPAYAQGGQRIRPVLDSAPYQPPPSCNFVKADGSVCGAKVRGAQQIETKTCLGHLRFRKVVDDDDES